MTQQQQDSLCGAVFGRVVKIEFFKTESSATYYLDDGSIITFPQGHGFSQITPPWQKRKEYFAGAPTIFDKLKAQAL